MKKILKLIANIISYAIFLVLVLIIILLLLYVVNVKFMQKSGRLSEIPYNFYIILTQSMHPTIKAGDMIVTYRIDDGYEKGDVITFVPSSGSTKGVTITHRIINYVGEMYQTQGDNNNTADTTLISKSDVIGKVLFKIPKVGFLQQFIATKFGWLVVIVIPCLGIIIYDILKLVKKAIKKNKNTVIKDSEII